jgi:hypothetical protein
VILLFPIFLPPLNLSHTPHFAPACACYCDMIHWLSRCIPGLSALCLFTLLVFAFSGVGPPPQLQRPFSRGGQYGAQLQDNFDVSPLDLRPSQKVFIFYTLLVHIDTALFALRLLFSIIVVKRKIRSTLLRRPDIPSGFYSEGILQPTDAQELELRSAQSDQNVDKLEQSSSAHEVVHAIILPNYQEDIGTLRMTLSVLAAHPRAVTQYKVSPICSNRPSGFKVLIVRSFTRRYSWLWSKRKGRPPRRRLC